MPGLHALASLTLLCLVACSGAATEAVSATSDLDDKLAAARTSRNKLQAVLDKTPESVRQGCEAKEGECLISSREMRGELSRSRQSSECQSKLEPGERAECEIEQRMKSGERKDEVLKYYEYGVWCLEGIVACLDGEVKVAADRERQRLVLERKAKFDTRERSNSKRGQIDLEVEKAKYLRSTLPPVADGACQDLEEVTSCKERVVAANEAFEAELGKPKGTYDPKRAKGLHDALYEVEAECPKPELVCLEETVKKYGAGAATRKRLLQNYDLLRQRQELIDGVSPERAEACNLQGITKNQKRVVDAYLQYAKNPGPYFRVQVHLAFRQVFKDQMSCLRSSN